MSDTPGELQPDEVLDQLKRFHFDTALVMNEPALAALMGDCSAWQLLPVRQRT